MVGIIIKSEEEQLAEGATFLDDMDMIISPNGGHLVPVAMKHGVHVCWACGEQFDESNRQLRLVEKRVGGPVPIGVHAKCVDPKDRKPFFDVAKGLQIRRELAKVAKASSSIVQAAAEGAKKVVSSVFGDDE